MPDSEPPRHRTSSPPDATGEVGGNGAGVVSREELAAALRVILPAVREAGAIGLSHFRKEVRVEHKADGSPVTEVDLAIDALLRERISKAFPEDGWLSEEGEKGCHWLSCRRAWVVDPLDGTRGFLHGKPHWCIAVALLVTHVPVLGVLHAPAMNSTWWATLGGGAFMDGERLHVSRREKLEGSRIIGPMAITRPECWDDPWPRVQVRRYPSLALRLAFVADGRADAMLAPGGKNYWDVAAGDILVREAGGRVTDITGAALRYDAEAARVNGVIAAGEGLFDIIRAHAVGFRCAGRGRKRGGRCGNEAAAERKGDGRR